jgi:hypothetical protein
MITTFAVQHYEHAADRRFEEVVPDFDAATRPVENGELSSSARA